MALTLAQLQTLKTSIAANTNTVLYAGSQTAINVVPNNDDGNIAIAGWYNLTAVPDYFVWRDLPMETVLNTITFASMTPSDAVPTADALTVQIWTARSLSCQGKQFNLQNLTIGRSTAPMKRSNYRAAMQDCLTNIPAGAAGALIAANWVGVRDGAKFTATNAEELFASGAGTTANPSDLSFEGKLSGADISAARNS